MVDHAARIADNLARVRARIGQAALLAGRKPSDVQLVGVVKYVDAELAAYLLQAGCTLLGESRPQQLWEKAGDPRLEGAKWHLIGHLQSNKARRTLPLVDLLHSADSAELVDALDQHAARQQRPVHALIEVNCSGESEKHGVQPYELDALIGRLDELAHVRIDGLMTMAPRSGGPDAARRSFAALRQLRDELAPLCPANVALKELSMGMSGDLEQAIAEGATIVRIGSLLWEGVA